VVYRKQGAPPAEIRDWDIKPDRHVYAAVIKAWEVVWKASEDPAAKERISALKIN